MKNSIIKVENISKTFKINKKRGLKRLFSIKSDKKRAVDNISFDINEGEMVGFIGKNGAGKSTTVKMLSGILYPDEGNIEVDGFIPYKDRKKYVANIGVVFGQKTQLAWDLPLIDSFELIKEIYKVPEEVYKDNLKKFVDLLDMKDFLNQPVRQLSLGQRMKGDIVCALIHSPKIVFFDEPTIGLDVIAKNKIREFIKYLNKTQNITMVFTTHDMQDIEQVCNRLIIIDHGKKIYDGTVEKIKEKFGTERTIEVLVSKDNDIENIDEIICKTSIENGNIKKIFRFDSKDTDVNYIMTKIFENYDVIDIKIKEPEIDDIIRKIYEGDILSL